MMRALVQKCSVLKVNRLITFGSPHQGVAAFPGCGDVNGWAKWSPTRWMSYMFKKVRQKLIPCSVMNTLVGASVYSSSAQTNILPAQYYKDPKKMPDYYRANKFLIDVNNETAVPFPHYLNVGLGPFVEERVKLQGESDQAGQVCDLLL